VTDWRGFETTVERGSENGETFCHALEHGCPQLK